MIIMQLLHAHSPISTSTTVSQGHGQVGFERANEVQKTNFRGAVTCRLNTLWRDRLSFHAFVMPAAPLDCLINGKQAM